MIRTRILNYPNEFTEQVYRFELVPPALVLIPQLFRTSPRLVLFSRRDPEQYYTIHPILLADPDRDGLVSNLLSG